MNTPPPPPLRHFRSPYDSPYEIRTPSTPRSFEHLSGYTGSNHFSDLPRSSRAKLETRHPAVVEDHTYFDQPTVTQPTGITAAMVSTINKDFLYFVFTRAENAKWDAEPIIEEIPAAQAEIKKKSEVQSKRGSAIQQLQHMGPNRRAQIDRFVKTLTNMETDGSLWEVVWLKNTKEKHNGKAMEVNAFQMIIARSQPINSNRNSTGPIPLSPSAFAEEAIRFEFDEKIKKEKRKSKDRRATETPIDVTHSFDDPFVHSLYADAPGAASTKYAQTGSGYTDLPPPIQPKKHSTTVKANIIDGLDPDKEEFLSKSRGSSSKAADDFLRNIPKTSVDPGRKVGAEVPRRHSTHARQNSDGRPRSVRFSSQFGLGIDPVMSSNSSNASGDLGTVWDDFEEVETLNSLTSGDTSESQSSSRKRSTKKDRTESSQSQGFWSYELSGKDGAQSSGRSRRQSSRVTEQVESQKPYGVEQPRTQSRRNTSPKQRLQREVPPAALYPDEIDNHEAPRNEEEQAHNVADYIRNSIKESQDKVRKEEKKHRESMSMREQLGNLRLDREFGQTRSTVYTHEPRDRAR